MPTTPPHLTRHRRTLVVGGLATALLVAGAGAAFASGTGQSPTATPQTGSASTKPAPGAPSKPKPHLDGTVTTAEAGVITITDPDGFTRTIRTNSGTRYSGGLTATIKAGTRVHAEGTIDNDTVSLDASTIGTMPTPPLGGPKPPAPPRGSQPQPPRPAPPATPRAHPAPAAGGTATPAPSSAAASGS